MHEREGGLRANDILVSKCFYLNADEMVYNRGGPRLTNHMGMSYCVCNQAQVEGQLNDMNHAILLIAVFHRIERTNRVMCGCVIIAEAD